MLDYAPRPVRAASETDCGWGAAFPRPQTPPGSCRASYPTNKLKFPSLPRSSSSMMYLTDPYSAAAAYPHQYGPAADYGPPYKCDYSAMHKADFSRSCAYDPATVNFMQHAAFEYDQFSALRMDPYGRGKTGRTRPHGPIGNRGPQWHGGWPRANSAPGHSSCHWQNIRYFLATKLD